MQSFRSLQPSHCDADTDPMNCEEHQAPHNVEAIPNIMDTMQPHSGNDLKCGSSSLVRNMTESRNRTQNKTRTIFFISWQIKPSIDLIGPQQKKKRGSGWRLYGLAPQRKQMRIKPPSRRAVFCNRKTTPEGPSTQYLRTLVPNTIKGMVFGTRDLRYWVLRPSGNNIVLKHICPLSPMANRLPTP